MSAGPITPPVVTDDDAEQQLTPLEQLRASFQRERQDPRLYKDLPAGENLVAVYRVLSTDETKEALSAEEDVDQNLDTLIRALDYIGLHLPGHEDANDRGIVPLHKLLPPEAGGPVRFDKRLLTTAGIELDKPTSRAIALRMFDGNEIAMGSQSAAVMAWMTDTSMEALQDFAKGS